MPDLNKPINPEAISMHERIALGGYPLDKMDEFRRDKVWLEENIKSSNAKFLFYHQGRVLMNTESMLDLAYFPFETASPYLKKECTWILLGKKEENLYFACDPKAEIELHQEGLKWIDVRSAVGQLDANLNDNGKTAIIGCAVSMLNWHNSHPFCSKCGSKSKPERAGFLRKCQNSDCQGEHFPRTDPVVIMVATMGDKCLLGRSPHFLPGVYSALAGFMEPGETIEEAVRRELWEEAGIRVGKVSYLKSQPWPFPSSLMIGCIAEALTDEITFNDGELEDARWFSKNEIKVILENKTETIHKTPTKMAIAYHLIKYWAQQGE